MYVDFRIDNMDPKKREELMRVAKDTWPEVERLLLEKKQKEELMAEKFLNGGLIKDNAYKLKMTIDQIYVIKDEVPIKLSKMISHVKFFDKYPLAKDIKVSFFTIEDVAVNAEFITSNSGLRFCEIRIGLNRLYYEKNNREKFELIGGYPEFSLQATLLHEMQHVCQFQDRGDVGRSYEEIYKDKSAKRNGLSRALVEEEAFDTYKFQKQEQEAMKSVYDWLYSIGLKYGDPQYILPYNFSDYDKDIDQKNSLDGIYENGGKIDGSSGGILHGLAHADGGIKAIVADNKIVELEGGEVIINKKSAEMFLQELSNINVAGGGVPIIEDKKSKFSEGGKIKKQHKKVYQAIGDRNKLHGQGIYLTDTFWAAQLTSHELNDRVGVGEIKTVDILDSVKILDIENEKLNLDKVRQSLPEEIWENALSYQLNNYKGLLNLVKYHKIDEPNRYLVTALGYDGIKYRDYRWDDQDYWPEDIIGTDYKNGGIPVTYVIYNNTSKILIRNENKGTKVHLQEDEETED